MQYLFTCIQGSWFFNIPWNSRKEILVKDPKAWGDIVISEHGKGQNIGWKWINIHHDKHLIAY